MNTKKSNSLGRFGSARLRNQNATNSMNQVEPQSRSNTLAVPNSKIGRAHV